MNRQDPPPPPVPNERRVFKENYSDVIDVTPNNEKAEPSPAKRKTVGNFGAGLSLVLAMFADALQLSFPAIPWLSDAVMVIALLLIWGVRYEMLLVIVPEAIPGVSVFPTWTLFVVYLAGQQMMAKKK